MSEAKVIKFERRKGEETVLELDPKAEVKEVSITIESLTANFATLVVKPGGAVKRVMKVEGEFVPSGSAN